ncbi:(d)CMP kinase [Tannerella forsythia]|uniref:(d)CMP kinase n=1 Tax=Tannerella forsythia TaxID=28112 RepID=UPI000618B772|nr:(d)CMP kinase [Tannerella forsythia]BAR48450.1 cytidylate kinase [Tannerella forsythia 3313]
MKKIIVAVDGFSSCGKSTMARALAKAVGYTYIDTGAMYRAVTLYAIRQGFFHGDTLNEAALQQAMDNVDITFWPNPETGMSETFLNGESVETEIRSMEVSNRVSRVAALGFVRHALVSKQQAMGEARGIVMDGRDIGTVVFPQAELKIFVIASAEIRAQRRVKEMNEKGQPVSFDEVLKNVQGRDKLDMTRAESPLRKADDAIELDNTYMTIAEQQAWLMREFRKATEK